MTHKGKPETVFIAITQPDGNVAVMQFITLVKRIEDDPGQVREATPENIEAEIVKSRIAFTSWRVVDPSEIPQDRTFRNAWADSGEAIGHDMAKVAAIHMERIRTARNVRLAETDRLVSALDGGPMSAELKAQRQKLRDIPQELDLSGAATIEALKAIWPEELS